MSEGYVPIRKRRKLDVLKKIAPVVKEKGKDQKPSLLEVARQLKLQDRHAEEILPGEYNTAASKCLVPVSELAKGVKYDKPIQTSWRPPSNRQQMSEQECNAVRNKWRIAVDGEDVPPPLERFEEMRFQKAILQKLKDKKVDTPTPIQVQGLPVALSGRDMIAVATTGSGKTVTFVLPLVMLAMEEELRRPFTGGEGPFGLILCPTHELARQTYNVVEEFASVGSVRLRSMLCLGGGHDMRFDMEVLKRKGIHIVVATPGKLVALLERKAMILNRCKYVTLDEADRLLDWEETKKVFDYFSFQRQTLLFSATMPSSLQKFARNALVKPVVVNAASRAGAANLDVIQEVEYVKEFEKGKLGYLLETIQKTAPPVLVFCNSTASVEVVHEMLLSVEFCFTVEAIHGQIGNAERQRAISSFRDGSCDILVATDVVSKGLDFPGVEHVINFDMPREISDYVHRIGRTGRCGKTGIATTFVNSAQDGRTLADLKHLLVEAKQKVPEFLLSFGNEGGGGGCDYCGGLGHGIKDCPKVDGEMRRSLSLLNKKVDVCDW